MTQYARPAGGITADVFTPPDGLTIAQCWPPTMAEQFVAVPDGQVAVPGGLASQANGVWSFGPVAAPSLTPAQQVQFAYDAAIAGGLSITSTGTPALNGVYAIDPDSTGDIATEAQFISTFSEFTNGTSSNLVWGLQNQQSVTFPGPADFLAFAKAAAQAVAAAKLAALQGSPMPAMSKTIP